MTDFDLRTRLIVGENGVAKLENSRVAVFGLGGVGSFCTEALARAGVGALDLIDNDVITV
ncbi:MAG: ThiF family adenylyltransferase, partial [Clostridia bacterium]|nr:ThiF family adenylyltransferase [Clostridia bacterium]